MIDLSSGYEGTSATARRLGVTDEWVRHLADTGEIEGVVRTPVGRLFPVAAAEEFAKRRQNRRRAISGALAPERYIASRSSRSRTDSPAEMRSWASSLVRATGRPASRSLSMTLFLPDATFAFRLAGIGTNSVAPSSGITRSRALLAGSHRANPP